MVNCVVCEKSVPDLEAHIAESHSDPGQKYGKLTEAEYIRERADEPISRLGDDDVPDDKRTAQPVTDVLDDLGIKLDSLKTAIVTTETGAQLTAPEAKRVLEAVENLVGWRIDRASFIVNFVDWGIRNSFSEELNDAGGFYVVSDPTVSKKQEYFKVQQLHNHINEYFGVKNTGRLFTFRRFGRYLARSIPKIVENNAKLNEFYVSGSPMSNRLGVAPNLFLTVTSIFEYIKPYQKWSREEKAAWTAHNTSVVKMANTQNTEFLPADLRPSPSQASTLVDAGGNDFGKRNDLHDNMQRYGKGASIFHSMMNGQTAHQD